MSISNAAQIWSEIIDWADRETGYIRSEDPCLSPTRIFPTRRVMFYITDKITEMFAERKEAFEDIPALQPFVDYYTAKSGQDLWNEWDEEACELFRYEYGANIANTGSFLDFLKNHCAPKALTNDETATFQSIAIVQYDELIKFMKGEEHALDAKIMIDNEVKLHGKSFLSMSMFSEIYNGLISGDAAMIRRFSTSGQLEEIYTAHVTNSGEQILRVGEFLPLRYGMDYITQNPNPRTQDRNRFGKWMSHFNPSGELNILEKPKIIAAITAKLTGEAFNWESASEALEEDVGNYMLKNDIAADSDTDLRGEIGSPCVSGVSGTNESFLRTVAFELINEVTAHLTNERTALDGIPQKGRAPLGGGSGSRRSSGSGGGSRRRRQQGSKVFDASGGGNTAAGRRAATQQQRWADKDEADPDFNQYIKDEYYNAAGCCRGFDPETDEGAWSAAFISFVVNDGDIRSGRHADYMKAAKNKRDGVIKDPMNRQAYQNAVGSASRNYFAFLPEEKHPVDGDLCCYGRGASDGWDSIGPENHCDVYVGTKVIGGNLSGKIGIADYREGKYSMIISKGAVITVPDDNS